MKPKVHLFLLTLCAAYSCLFMRADKQVLYPAILTAYVSPGPFSAGIWCNGVEIRQNGLGWTSVAVSLLPFSAGI